MEEDATTEGIEGESEKTQICHTLICHYSRVLLEQNICCMWIEGAETCNKNEMCSAFVRLIWNLQIGKSVSVSVWTLNICLPYNQWESRSVSWQWLSCGRIWSLAKLCVKLLTNIWMLFLCIFKLCKIMNAWTVTYFGWMFCEVFPVYEIKRIWYIGWLQLDRIGVGTVWFFIYWYQNALKHDMTVGKMVFSDWLCIYLSIRVLKI